MGKAIIDTVSTNLKKARAAKGQPDEPLSREALAKKSGVAANTLKNIEEPQSTGATGRLSAPRLDNLAKIARAFECEPWQFLVPGLDINNKPTLVVGDDAELLRRFHMLNADAKAEFLRSLPNTPKPRDETSGRGPAGARKMGKAA